MRPLTPQPPARVAWEDAMLEAMQAMYDDLTRSDAQGLSEIADELVDKLYAWGDFTPEQAARVVLGWPTPERAAQEEANRIEDLFNNPNWVGSRHHY